MDGGILFSIIELLSYDLLAVSIGEKVDGASRNHSDQSRAQSSEQCRYSFVSEDISRYIGCVFSLLEHGRRVALTVKYGLSQQNDRIRLLDVRLRKQRPV